MGLSTLVIVNTEARNVRFGRRWSRHEADVMRRLAPAELEIIDAPGDAEQTAWNAAVAGYGRLVIVGDLATASAFVNGLMRLADSHRRSLKIGFLALGRPNAWCRTLGLSADIGRQLDILSAAHVFPHDVGRVSCVGLAGEPVTRHFLAGAALWPASLQASEGGAVSAAVVCDGDVVDRGKWQLAFAMLSPYYPGMGLVAPRANPTDGVLDLAWVDATGGAAWAKRLLVSLLHFPAGLSRTSAGELRLECSAGSPAIHADGTPVGTLPATISVVPRALPVIVEPVASRLREKLESALAELPGAALAGHFNRHAQSSR